MLKISGFHTFLQFKSINDIDVLFFENASKNASQS
jgi:hypothetical protein